MQQALTRFVGSWLLVLSSTNGVALAQPGKSSTAYGSDAVDPKVTARLSAQEQIKHFIVPKDFAIELVAADPAVSNPITMVLDGRGRIIVSESHTYRYGPGGSPIKPFANPVIRLDLDGKGGFSRTLVADGFDDPVMGIAVKNDKLWLSANNFLYQYDLLETAPAERQPGEGVAVKRKTLLTDNSKAWNPFGMFVLEWGPDGKLYMSVGNHNIDIAGPDGKITARGGSGLILRMNPDGTKMERLVHGLRVPYSFEFDPFGQLWLLSNGEGNPNRFVRVIDGVDYHCYSRGNVDNDWLAGKHPLAPPSEEVHGGAHTQFMRYYAAAYPAEYQGNLFACNWGRHGFAGGNRGIFRFVLDERNNVVKKDTLVACADPHFRPAHVILDQDGSLLIADWYGRDDESDMTGRIWRLKYVGKDGPVVTHKLDSPEWQNDEYAISALGSPDHLIRDKAMDVLIARGGKKMIEKLKVHAATAKEPVGAANALWTLMRFGREDMQYSYGETNHPDWRVRRLRLNLARSHAEKPGWNSIGLMSEFARIYKEESHPAVLCERAVIQAGIHASSAAPAAALVDALHKGAAADVHLRYEAAWHLARRCDETTLSSLLISDDADVRLAGLIAIDIACYENFPTRKIVLEALAKALENPDKLDQQLLLSVAHLNGDASIVPSLERLCNRDDVPAATIAKAVLVLKAKAGASPSSLSAQLGKRLIEAVETGSLKVTSPADQLVIFEFLEAEGPTPFALKQIEGQLRSNNAALKQAAHTLARRFAAKAAPLADTLWASAVNPKTKFEDAIEYLSTIARVEAKANSAAWKDMLAHKDPFVRAETVRWWRQFKDDRDMVAHLAGNIDNLIEKDRSLRDDIGMVYRHYGYDDRFLKEGSLAIPERDKAVLTKVAIEELANMPAADRPKRAAMGLQVFERNACTKCHTTATQLTLLAPSLKGVASQKVEYLIESVLFPSKIIKTGWEVQQIELKNGRTLSGLVKDEGKFLRVLALDKDERVLPSDIESRAVSKLSVMPEGQEATLSRREFVDLIAYLATIK